MRLKALMVLLVLAPAMAGAQAKPAQAKPVEKKAAKPAMMHDSTMKHEMMAHDSSMKHDMSGMKMDSAMNHAMPGMKGGMMQGGMKGGMMKGGMKGGMMKGGMKGGMKQGGMQGGMMGGMKGGMKSGWGELDAFHTLLMAMWHPAQKDTLVLARSLAGTLAASGEAWEKSKGPAACDNAEARKALPAIVADAKAHANAVASKADDAGVKAALKKVHDGFEKVGKPCMMASMHPKGAAKDSAKKPMDAMDHSAHHPAAKKP